MLGVVGKLLLFRSLISWVLISPRFIYFEANMSQSVTVYEGNSTMSQFSLPEI